MAVYITQINRAARPAAWAEHVKPRRPRNQGGPDCGRPQDVTTGSELLVPALNDALGLGACGCIGNLPLGIEGNVEPPRPYIHGAVLPESGGAAIALHAPSALPGCCAHADGSVNRIPPKARGDFSVATCLSRNQNICKQGYVSGCATWVSTWKQRMKAAADLTWPMASILLAVAPFFLWRRLPHWDAVGIQCGLEGERDRRRRVIDDYWRHKVSALPPELRE